MTYAQPLYVVCAIYAAIVLIALYALFERGRSRLLRRFADKELLGAIAPSLSPLRRWIKYLLVTAAVTLTLLACAEPQWGFEWQEVKRTGLDIFIALDTSKSMMARDIKPNRLERCKYAIKDMLKKLNGDRVGLIAFAGTAFVQCPLTIDYNGFMLTLDDVGFDTIPRPGTSIARAIDLACDSFKGPDKKYKVLIILSDGEDWEGDAVKAAERAAREGVRIFTVGVATPEGELIPSADEHGQNGYLADHAGNAVKTRLNEELLKKIALTTGGSYVRSSRSEFGLMALYDKGISRLEKRELDSKMKKKYEERYQIFVAAAICLLVLESLVSERKRRAP